MEMVHDASRARPSLKQIVLSRILPANFKRIIFISSLYGFLHRQDDKYVLMKGLADINERLDLADSVSGLVFPAKACVVYWDNLVLPEHALENEDLETLVRRVLTSAPQWLNYRSKADMAVDIKKMLACSTVVTEQKVVHLYN